jgi:phosphoserine aminotransferase
MTDKPEYIGICFACGKPLTLLDLAVTIEDRTVDWDERTTIDNTKSTFCRHCANNAKEYLKGGIKEAVKRYEMDEQTIARLKELDENDLMKAARSEIMIGS